MTFISKFLEHQDTTYVKISHTSHTNGSRNEMGGFLGPNMDLGTIEIRYINMNLVTN